MPTEEFDAIIEAFIKRETQDTGELDAPLFYKALRDVLGVTPTDQDFEVEGEIVNNQLVLNLPEDLESENYSGNISLLFGDRRIMVKLKDDTIYPTAN